MTDTSISTYIVDRAERVFDPISPTPVLPYTPLSNAPARHQAQCLGVIAVLQPCQSGRDTFGVFAFPEGQDGVDSIFPLSLEQVQARDMGGHG